METREIDHESCKELRVYVRMYEEKVNELNKAIDTEKDIKFRLLVLFSGNKEIKETMSMDNKLVKLMSISDPARVICKEYINAEADVKKLTNQRNAIEHQINCEKKIWQISPK